MTDNQKVYGIIALITVFAIPIAMACAKVDVSPWMLIAGHAGSMLVGFLAAGLSRPGS